MENLTSPREIIALLKKHGFHFTKGLGQNFLIDDNILKQTVDGADIHSDDNVLEIGPGIGTLTRSLGQRAHHVVAVEIDRRLLPILKETLSSQDNVSIIHGDILKIDVAELILREFDGHPFKIVANLPYYITTPIVMSFLESKLPYQSITMMIQKEVADRMKAAPGTKDYGALSVAVQYYSQPQILVKAPSSVFMPAPKVDSVVIKLNRLEQPPIELVDQDLFFTVVRASFSQRRKTILNAISAYAPLGLHRGQTEALLKACSILPIRRGETLSLEEFGRVSDYLFHNREAL